MIYWQHLQSNEFRVTDPDMFEKIFESMKYEGSVDIRYNPVNDKYSFIIDGNFSGLLLDRNNNLIDAVNKTHPDYKYAMQKDFQFKYNAFITYLSQIIPDDEAVIIEQVTGQESYDNITKMTACLTVVTYNKYETITQHDHAIEIAKRLTDNKYNPQ